MESGGGEDSGCWLCMTAEQDTSLWSGGPGPPPQLDRYEHITIHQARE